jgi:two-component SAPR family response regulator
MLDKVLIVSANGMFRAGIISLLKTRQDANQLEIIQADSMPETLRLLNEWQPELIILDHDDQKIQKEEFLNYFVRSQFTVKVLLISLLSNGSVVVYDRRSLLPEEVTEYLQLPISAEKLSDYSEKENKVVEEKK